MDNKILVTIDEFANAIVASRLPKKSMRVFFEALTSPGRKEKHAGWIRVCENIREAKNMTTTSKAWRKSAHTLFMENLVQIEQLVWDKLMLIPVGGQDSNDVVTAVTSALNTLPMEEDISEDEKNEIQKTFEDFFMKKLKK